MANELNLTLQSGATCYVVIRRHSDGYAWDNTAEAWEVWADGSIDDYDIALTDDGGDLYSGDFPTAIAAGTRVIVGFYTQAGGTAAITDLLLGSRDLTWNGASAAEGESISLDSRVLTTLASAKRYLRITASTDDDFLTELINQVSDRIERYCGRRFAAANYREWLDGSRQDTMSLKHWPIINVFGVGYGATNALSVTYTGSAIRATVDVYHSDEGDTGGVRCQSIASDGTVTTNDVAFATYASASAVATQITTLTGWTGTLIKDCPSLDMNMDFAGDADDKIAYLTFPGEFDVTVRWDHRTGRGQFISGANFPWTGQTAPMGVPRGMQNVLVKYRAGYATMPDDLNLLCNEMVAEAYRSGQHDTNLASESLGDYSYSLASQVQLKDDRLARLVPYMDIR